MMHMTLYWGKEVTILFDSWKTDSWFSYSVSLFACLLSALFYQYMEARRIRLNLLSYLPPPESPATDLPLLGSKPRRARKYRIDRFIAAILVAVNAAIGYLLMLAIMSFNGGVLLAVVLGLGIGYLLFRGDEDGGAAVVLESSCACA